MSGAALRIHGLEIEGFKAFAAPQSFEISGHVFVFGANGLGKSSVVEAIRWCLFGLADRPEAEVRNVFYPPGECKVKLKLSGPGGTWTIQRRLRPGASRSDLTIQDPNGATVPQSRVLPNLARLGPREGTHIIFASQQSTHRRPQADITDFDKVLYSYLQIDDVPDLIDRLQRELDEQVAVERQLAEELDNAEESLRSELNDLRSRIDENLASPPWPGERVPTNAETDARIRAFVTDCGASVVRADGDTATREWLLSEAERKIQHMSETTHDAVENQLNAARDDLQQLNSRKQTFDDLTEQLTKAQGRVETCEKDLNNKRRESTTEQLLRKRRELLRENAKLGVFLELMQNATGYFEEYSPGNCPLCDARVEPAAILSRIEYQRTSDHRTAELSEALESVQALLKAIDIAEGAVATAREERRRARSEVAVARKHVEELLDDPVDLSNIDHIVNGLSEHIRELEFDLSESGGLVASKRNRLRKLRAEARFQSYRARQEVLSFKLETGLEDAREVLREYNDMLDTLRGIRTALQGSFNDTLNGTLTDINRLMTEVFGRLTQQASFPKIVVEPNVSDEKRSLHIRVTSSRTPGESFDPSEVLNGQAFNAVNLVPYFVFSKFQADALELDCLLIDDPSQSFDTSRVKLLMRELRTAGTHAQLIVASHEEDRFRPSIEQYFSPGSYRVLRVKSFAPNMGPTLESAD